MARYEVDVQRPDLKDPHLHTILPQTRIDWLRQVCPQAELNTQQVILGECLGNIFGDDHHAFTKTYRPELNEEQRERLAYIMNVRINTPELPENIRQRLIHARDHILAIDWHTEGGWREARDYYEKNVAQFVERESTKRRKLREARLDAFNAAPLLSEAWQEFLGGG